MGEHIAPSQIAKVCNDWVWQIRCSVQDKIRASLAGVDAFDKIFYAINRIDRTTNRPDMVVTWQDINENLFKGEINLWEFYLRDIAIDHLKVLIRDKLNRAFSTLGSETIDQVVMITHQDALNLVWTEDPSEPVSISRKAYRIYDEYLQVLAEFERQLKETETQLSVIQVNAKNFSMMSTEDLTTLRNFFKDLLHENVKNLIERLNSALDPNDSYLLQNLADFCRTLLFASPNFKSCHFLFGGDDFWMSTKLLLQNLYASTLITYLEMNLLNLIETFKQEMSLDPITNLISICSIWDEIAIQDTSEDGKTIQSTYRVPVQISSPLFRFLNSINEAINQCSAHTTNLDILSTIIRKLTDCLNDVYKLKLTEITDNKSYPSTLKETLLLQFLFDIYLVKRLVSSTGDNEIKEEIGAKLKDLLNEYRSKLDPVYLHVLEEHIERSLEACLSAMFLLLSSIFQKLSSTNIQKVHLSDSLISKKHILMPCYSYESHFLTLPLKKDG